MMTGSSDTERDSRSRRSVSMPLMPGIMTSSSTASMRCGCDQLERLLRRSRPSAPCSPTRSAGATARRGSSRRRRRAGAWRIGVPWRSCSRVPARAAASILSSRPAKVDRLGVEVVAAGVERPLAVADHGVRGQRDDRDPPGRRRRPSIAGRTPSRRSPACPDPSGSDRDDRCSRHVEALQAVGGQQHVVAAAQPAGATARRDSTRCLRRSEFAASTRIRLARESTPVASGAVRSNRPRG